MDNVSDSCPSQEVAPTLRLLQALRAGKSLAVAADVASLPPVVAASVADSPLAKALLRLTCL
jgi:hypothetical protein